MVISPLIDPFALHNVVDDISPQLGGDLDGQSYNFSTAGTITVKGMLLSNVGGYSIIKAADSNGLALESDDGVNRIYFTDGGDIYLNPEGGEVRVDGEIISGDLLPSVGTADIGSSGNRWDNCYVTDLYANGNVGFGTTGPDTTLHVKGDHVSGIGQLKIEGDLNEHAFMSIDGASGKIAGCIFSINSTSKFYWQCPSTGDSIDLYSYGWGDYLCTFEDDGDVKFPHAYDHTVGATNVDLYVDNDGYIGKEPSGLDYKENIKDLDATDRIYQLRPVRYDRKDGSGKNLMGLIAEEVATVMSEAVSFKRTPVKKGVFDEISGEEIEVIDHYETTDTPESVSYTRLIPAMLKELQVLRQEIDELRVA